MKYIRQLMIIICLSFCGELLNMWLPLPVPGSIYGFLLMFIGLLTGLIKLEQVKETAGFLVEIMPMMFIPAGVGLMVSWKVLAPILIPFVVITLATTIAVMAAAGHVTQYVIRAQQKKAQNNRKEQGR